MKKKKLLKKYQFGNTNTNFGGGSSAFSTPKLKTWNPSYKMGPTGDLKFNTPDIKPFTSKYGIDYSGSSGSSSSGSSGGGGGIGDYSGMIAAGVSALAGLPGTIRQTNDMVAAIREAKRGRTMYNYHEGMNRAAGVWNSAYSDRYGNTYGNSQGKHGGYLPKHELGGTQDFSGMYGSSTYRNPESDYNSQLAAMRERDVTQNMVGDTISNTLDTAVSSVPGWGAIMAAAIQASKMTRGFLGEHQERQPELSGTAATAVGLSGTLGANPGTALLANDKEAPLVDVYYAQDSQVGSTDSEAGAAAKGAVGSFAKPFHEHAADEWGKAAATDDSGEKAKHAVAGIMDIAGLSWLPRMIKSGADSAAASQRAKVTATRTSNKSMVGGTAGYGGSGSQRINRSKVGSQFAQIKQGEMGGYLEKYKGGGHHIPSYRQGTQLGIAQEVPRDMANAEVEGGGIKRMKKGGAIKEKGETIYNAMNGTMDVVMGAKHASDNAAVQKGVPVVLKEGSPAEGGDLVFSDVAMIKDPATGKKAPASDLSIKYKDNPEILSYIAAEQSRIAQIKNSKKKNGGMLKQYQQGTYSEFDKMLTLDSLQQELRTDSYNPKDTATLSEFDKKILDDAAIKSNPLMHPQLRSWKSKIGTYNLAEKQRIQDEMLELEKAVNSINIENADSFQKNLIEKSTKEKLGRAGTLKKYQQGTPTLTQAEIDALNALQGSGAPPNFMQRQQAAQQAAQTSQAPATYQAAAAQAQQQVAAQIAQSKAQTANQASSNNSLGSNWVIKNGVATMIPSSSAATTTTTAAPTTTTPAVTSTVLPARTGKYTNLRSKLPSQKGLNAAGQPYNFSVLNTKKGKKGKKAQAAAAAANAAVASTKSGTPTINDFYDDKGKLFGEKSGWQKALDSGGLEMGLMGLGAAAQIGAALGRKNPYKGLKGPSYTPITSIKSFFDRADYRDQYTAADRAFARGQQTILASGAGPNTSANIQALENQRVSAYENIMGREMDFNMRQDAAEKQLNAETALRTNLQNQDMKFRAESAQSAINQLSEEFDSERGQAAALAFATASSDAAKLLTSGRYSRAILGDGPNMNNKMDVEAAMKQLKAKYPKQAGETEAEYSSRLGQYQNMIQAQLNSV